MKTIMSIEMLPDEIQIVIEANIPVGSKRRMTHLFKTDGTPCSKHKDAAMDITRTVKGFVFHCHRCGYKGFVGTQRLPADVIKKMIKSLDVKPNKVVEELTLPKDCIMMDTAEDDERVPMDAYGWLWKAGINNAMIKKYRLCWSPYYERVIIPIYNNSKLIAWVGREVMTRTREGRKDYGVPKYITRKSPEYGDGRVYFTTPSYKNSRENEVVIVEDIASAIRVHEAADIMTVALLNTSIPNDLILSFKDKELIFWLDPGQLDNMVGAVKRATSFGQKAAFINTNKDPKYYNSIAIIDQLNQAVYSMIDARRKACSNRKKKEQSQIKLSQ